MESVRTKQRVTRIVIHVILIIFSIIMIVPFLWMIITALKTNQEAISINPFYLFPQSGLHWENFATVWKSYNFLLLYINTLLLMLLRIICALVFSSMAGFAFAKLRFPFKRFFFFLVLTQMMLPNQIFIIPQYQMLASMNQLNSIFAVLFPGLVSAFGTFFLRQFYMSLPNVLSEAAVLDGCNTFQIFFKIMLPLTKTAMMALAVFTAVFAYSDMMWPLIVNNNINMMTLSAGISSMQGQYTTRYPILMAGSTLAMIPMLVLYLIFQRQFIEGIALTGTKG